jgi:hypothetical protein
MRLLRDPEQAMLGLLRQFLWAELELPVFVACEELFDALICTINWASEAL